MIKSIDTSSIHRLCSSQVVVDLATAVKELVENSLDAGATVIEIALTDFGETFIEVHDNARGIDPEDYHGLAMKHHTSKIEQFEDLMNVSSYGFRGEALNSLCELSGKFSVTTKRDIDTTGFRLYFDRLGRLSSQEAIARGTGTTILIENLFAALPVRRSEFVRNIKKQYQKMLKVIQAYALFATNVKIVMTNTTNGTRQSVLSTQQTALIENNICSVFGSKFWSTLQTFSVDVYNSQQTTVVINEEDDIDCSTKKECDHMTAVPRKKIGNVSGFISKVGAGIGRSDNDRQFVFCNGRPVDLPKLVKVINEVWRKYEMKQKPAFIVDIRIDRQTVDVNLAPNKREVLMENEEDLINDVKDAVDKLYAVSRNTFEVNECDTRKLTSFASFSAVTSSAQKLKQHAVNTAISQLPRSNGSNNENDSALDSPSLTMTSYGHLSPPVVKEDAPSSSEVTSTYPIITKVTWASSAEKKRLSQLSSSVPSSQIPSTFDTSSNDVTIVSRSSVNNDTDEDWAPMPYQIIPWYIPTEKSLPQKRKLESPTDEPNNISTEEKVTEIQDLKRQRREALAIIDDDSAGDNDLLSIRKNVNVRVIEKLDFARMRVLGQFNLGFMIVELDGDLYILDQHACDEKFRFEGLQRNTKIHQQPLLKPLVVEMTANLESVVEEHMSVFEANGFQLSINEQAPIGQRVSMLSMPFSKGTTFGVNDVLELASILCGDDGDDFYEGRINKNYLSLRNEPVSQVDNSKHDISSPSVNKPTEQPPRVLLPKIMTMFASRACRTAVMIGTALNKSEMRTIVQQMVSVEQPWNCPHGRPTMRHLLDYDALLQEIQEKTDVHAAHSRETLILDENTLHSLDMYLQDAYGDGTDTL